MGALAWSADSFFVCFLLVYAVMNPKNLLGRILSNPKLCYIGTASFSLYIFQQPFMARNGLPQSEMYFWERFPQNIILTFIVGFLCFELVEKPAWKLRDRFFKPKA